MKDLDLLSLAREVIAIDTTSSLSDGKLVEFLLPLCKRAGLRTTVQEETRDGIQQYNILASRRPLDEKTDTLLLNTHLDTVSPGDPALWTATGGNPFALTEHDGLLYGLGVADVKLDFLCKLLALAGLRRVRLRDNVALAGTYAEETGGYGAEMLVRELGRTMNGNLPSRVLVGEPTSLRPCISHKGYVEFRTEGEDPGPVQAPALPCWRLSFQGLAAHSSQTHRGASANSACLDALALILDRHTPEMGSPPAVLFVRGGDVVNKVAARCQAIVATSRPPVPAEILPEWAVEEGITCAVDRAECPVHPVWSPTLVGLLLQVHALSRRLEQRLRAWRSPGFEPPYSTVNNGLVELGPHSFSFAVDVRRVAGELPAEEVDAYEKAVDDLGQAAGDSGAGGPVRVRTERILESDPFRALPRSQLLGALMIELSVRGLPVSPELKSGATEAPVYHEAGMEVIIFGPGHSAGNIHRPNESIAVADLLRCIDIYQGLILRTCRGPKRAGKDEAS